MQATITLEARDRRFLRAAQDVLTKYRIVRHDPPPEPAAGRRARGSDGCIVFEVTGGTAPYTVTVHPEWAKAPACTCPDAGQGARERNAGYCKHIIAVLLSNDDLRCQLLELFL